MTTFLLDLWQDLRAKRLWPVAVALLAATVAVPVMLFKPASSTLPATDGAHASNAGKLPAVTLDASSVNGSHLNIFKEKNPFSVMSDPGTSLDQGTPDAGATTGGSSGTGSTSPAGGSTASGGTGSSTTPGSTGTTPPTGPDGKSVTPGVHYFTYTADVRFGLRGHVKDFMGIGELDLLPDGDNPVVAFMGVRDGKSAMFFIADPAFRADGEGTCQPSPDNCMFVSLTKDAAHDEETLFAENGQVEYVLQLTGLHVKTLSEAQAVGDATPDTSSPAAKKRSKKRYATLLSMPAVRLKR
jgi:hypothetical protein